MFIQGYNQGLWSQMIGGYRNNIFSYPYASYNQTPIFFNNCGGSWLCQFPAFNLSSPIFSPLKADNGASVDTGSKNYSDDDTKNFTYDAEALKNKWSRKNPSLSQAFFNKVVQVAKRVNCSPDDLMGLMKSESGLKSSITNSIGAVGLIQFLPNTAKMLGTTTDKLKNMSPEEQMVYVEKYLLNAKRSAGYSEGEKIGPGTLYALTYLPAYAKKDVLAQKNNDPKKYYAHNKGLDIDKDGLITKADLAARIKNMQA